MLGQIAEREIVFRAGAGVAIFRFSNRAENCMEAIIIGINSAGIFKKTARCIRLAEIHQGLCGAEIESEISFGRLGETNIEVGGLLRFPGELIGVGQFRLDV